MVTQIGITTELGHRHPAQATLPQLSDHLQLIHWLYSQIWNSTHADDQAAERELAVECLGRPQELPTITASERRKRWLIGNLTHFPLVLPLVDRSDMGDGGAAGSQSLRARSRASKCDLQSSPSKCAALSDRRR
jgi:hypothetical protein